MENNTNDVKKLHIAEIIKVLDHGTNVQFLCKDTRGLLSLYMEPDTFKTFDQVIQRAGFKLKGAKLEFNRDILRVTGKGKRWSISFNRMKE